ncbi:amidohydrolase family protein [uncultured Draconibacterium sp.]|uniref:amidohydrolase family protein n=1 Tax=uncultured Draconibacterium sp. TaxID=1573823 RepID=UPI0029C70DF4|nr:amidohydrolase family protein [uncultured Draconibacterium sp.]
MIIDTHHHYWNYNPVEFDWIDDEMAKIRQSFLPDNLKETLENTEVEGVVTVQARQCLEETDWLLKLAAENDFMRGVVGWLPLAYENIEELLEKYSCNDKLKAVRHVVQGEPDPKFILGKNFNRGISQLKKYGLIYDILILEHQLPNTIRFVDQHPDQQFVLDHIAKPRIKANEMEPWTKNIKELAKRKNVSCKISGMVTEADFNNWTEEQLKPYFEVVFNAFGPNRLMYGSDWPVCLVATEYANWLSLVKRQLAQFSENEQNMIFYKNAVEVYQL